MFRNPFRRSGLWPYLIAALLTGAGAAVRLVFLPALATRSPYITFYATVILAALFGGLAAGLTATVLSVFLADYFWIGPPMQFGIHDWLSTVVFLISGAMISATAEALGRARQRAAAAEAEARLAGERQRAAEEVRRVSDESERKLAEAGRRNTAILESISDGFNVFDREWRYIYVNAAGAKMVGKTREELLGKKVWELWPAAADSSFGVAYRRAMDEGIQLEVEAFYPEPLNRWYYVRCYPSPEGLSLFFNDVTERHKMQEALRESEERFRALVTASSDVLYRMSPDWSEMRYLHGGGFIADTDASSRDWLRKYIHPGDQAQVMAAIQEAIRNRSTFELEHRVLRADGSLGWTFSRAVPLKDADGEIREWFGAAADITQRKQAEEELRGLSQTLERRVERRTAELQASNKELEAFSYSVSHDLRAPLRAVEGFAGLLLRDYPGKIIDEKGSLYIQRMRAASIRMSELIDDLLKLSRLSRQEMEPRPTNLSEVAESIMEELKRRDPGRQVRVDVAPGVTANVDAHLIRVALDNLLGNAWKFTGKTSAPCIAFGVQNERREPVYFVRDNGAGFDMAHVEHLFAPFQRLHTQEEFEGTGVGLATVHRIIRRHGGRIWAEAKPGEGASFYFTIGGS